MQFYTDLHQRSRLFCKPSFSTDKPAQSTVLGMQENNQDYFSWQAQASHAPTLERFGHTAASATNYAPTPPLPQVTHVVHPSDQWMRPSDILLQSMVAVPWKLNNHKPLEDVLVLGGNALDAVALASHLELAGNAHVDWVQDNPAESSQLKQLKEGRVFLGAAGMNQILSTPLQEPGKQPVGPSWWGYSPFARRGEALAQQMASQPVATNKLNIQHPWYAASSNMLPGVYFSPVSTCGEKERFTQYRYDVLDFLNRVENFQTYDAIYGGYLEGILPFRPRITHAQLVDFYNGIARKLAPSGMYITQVPELLLHTRATRKDQHVLREQSVSKVLPAEDYFADPRNVLHILEQSELEPVFKLNLGFMQPKNPLTVEGKAVQEDTALLLCAKKGASLEGLDKDGGLQHWRVLMNLVDREVRDFLPRGFKLIKEEGTLNELRLNLNYQTNLAFMKTLKLSSEGETIYQWLNIEGEQEGSGSYFKITPQLYASNGGIGFNPRLLEKLLPYFQLNTPAFSEAKLTEIKQFLEGHIINKKNVQAMAERMGEPGGFDIKFDPDGAIHMQNFMQLEPGEDETGHPVLEGLCIERAVQAKQALEDSGILPSEDYTIALAHGNNKNWVNSEQYNHYFLLAWPQQLDWIYRYHFAAMGQYYRGRPYDAYPGTGVLLIDPNDPLVVQEYNPYDPASHWIPKTYPLKYVSDDVKSFINPDFDIIEPAISMAAFDRQLTENATAKACCTFTFYNPKNLFQDGVIEPVVSLANGEIKTRPAYGITLGTPKDFGLDIPGTDRLDNVFVVFKHHYPKFPADTDPYPYVTLGLELKGDVYYDDKKDILLPEYDYGITSYQPGKKPLHFIELEAALREKYPQHELLAFVDALRAKAKQTFEDEEINRPHLGNKTAGFYWTPPSRKDPKRVYVTVFNAKSLGDHPDLRSKLTPKPDVVLLP